MKTKVYKIKMTKGAFKGQVFETTNIPYGYNIPAFNKNIETITHEGNFEILGFYEQDIPMTKEQEIIWKEIEQNDFNRAFGNKMTGYEITDLLNKMGGVSE